MLGKIFERQDLHPSALISVQSSVERMGKTREHDALGVVEFHMPASYSPMSYSISVANNSPISSMISKSGSFIVNFMPQSFGNILNTISGIDPSFIDAFRAAGLTTTASNKVDGKLVNEALATLECEVIQEMQSGDHTVFVGRVLAASQK